MMTPTAIHGFLEMLNGMLNNYHEFYLNAIDLEVQSRDTDDNFLVEIQLDKDLGKVEVTLDPDYGTRDEEELVTFSAAEGFDLNIQANHCTTWALKSNYLNDTVISTAKDDTDNPIGIL